MSNERRELMQLIDDYRDMHGQPAEASVARAVGIAPQTLNSWRKRGIRQLPEKETLERLASFLGVSYEETVLKAALYDAGWSDDLPYLPGAYQERRRSG
ncbi:helix-turn-helix domain-containing protein [Nocardioides jensenii]|uniref:helix-turn-helix domain-containing protein n=1 Tax=Nocardioides jensenii TaxID=1843 RepID=UPI00082E1984|nr:helix-turn-helix transcriptional regulator [Nocardioides jensenii]